MGLDTDDIVALSVDIPIIVTACVLVVLAWVIRTKYLKKYVKTTLQLKNKNIGKRYNSKTEQWEEYNKSVLQVLVGDKLYFDYIEFLRSRNNGELPDLKDIDNIISPEAIYLETFYKSEQNNQ